MDHRRPPYTDLVRFEPSIRSTLASGSLWPTFPPQIEDSFEQTQGERRHRRYKIMGWLALFIFNMFIPTDALLLPDIYPLTMYVRLGFFTPLLLLGLAWLHHPSSERFRDAILVFLTMAAAACILFFLHLSQHPNVVHYHNGLILVIMFGTIIVRLPFSRAVACAVVILSGYIFTLSQMHTMAPELVINAAAVITVATFISLAANYQMELDARRAYAQDLLQDLDALRLEQANADLEHLSRLDALTELANRRTLDEAFDRAWRECLRHEWPLSLIMIDIDAFKPYNDTYGHPAGDLCLQKVACVLMGSLFRGKDLAARYGGEEFVILLPDTTESAVLHVAERLRDGVAELAIPHSGNPAAPIVTFSAGIATVIPTADMPPQRLLQLADEALYRAKQGGRNRIIVATPPAGNAV